MHGNRGLLVYARSESHQRAESVRGHKICHASHYVAPEQGPDFLVEREIIISAGCAFVASLEQVLRGRAGGFVDKCRCRT